MLELKNIARARDQTTSEARERKPDRPKAQKTTRCAVEEMVAAGASSPASAAGRGSSVVCRRSAAALPAAGGANRNRAASKALMPTSKLIAAATFVVERMPRLPTRKKPAPAAPTI